MPTCVKRSECQALKDKIENMSVSLLGNRGAMVGGPQTRINLIPPETSQFSLKKTPPELYCKKRKINRTAYYH
jgi:hypothetical protein